MQQGDLIQERYELEEELGAGGMAVVWRAFDRRLERRVAIKLIAPRYAGEPEFLVRFLSEAQSIARITHANVVSVLDFGQWDGRPFLVMELVSGGSAADLVGTPLLPERAFEIVADAARGAGAAHDLGIVHRDIKPANILLTEEGRGKLADFGIASSRGAEGLTATGAAIGSPHYISPEQASGKAATPASDVYALGVVLYELLAGRRPFEADTVMAVAMAHVDREPEPPSAHAPGLDPSLDAIVLACLAKDPKQRPADGRALAAVLGGEDLRSTHERPVAGGAAPAAGGPRRRTVLIGAAVALAALAGAWALSSGHGESVAQATTHLPRVHFKPGHERRSPTPTPSATRSAPIVAATPAPTPTPSARPSPRHTSTPAPRPSPTPSPHPSRSPSPHPSPTPSPDPSPSPTSTPWPGPSPQSTEEPGATPSP